MENEEVRTAPSASGSQHSHPYATTLAPKSTHQIEQATKDPPGWIEFASNGSIGGVTQCRPRGISVQISCEVFEDTIRYSGRTLVGDKVTDDEAATYRRGVTMVANKSDTLFSAIPHASALWEKTLARSKILKDSKQLSLDAAAKVIAVLQRMYNEASEPEISKPSVAAQFNPTHPDPDNIPSSQPANSSSPIWELQRPTQSNFVKKHYEQCTNADSALPCSERKSIWRNPNGEMILINGAHSINSAADNRAMRASATNDAENNVQPELGPTTPTTRQTIMPPYVAPLRTRKKVSKDQTFNPVTRELRWVPERFPTPPPVPKSAFGSNVLPRLILPQSATDTRQVAQPDSLYRLGEDQRPTELPSQSRFFPALPSSAEDVQDPGTPHANTSRASRSTGNPRAESAGNAPPVPDPMYLDYNPSVLGAPYPNPPLLERYLRAEPRGGKVQSINDVLLAPTSRTDEWHLNEEQRQKSSKRRKEQ
jgi:hypothetical protein